MKLKIKEEVVLEREIDLEGLLHVLKEESKVETPGKGGATVRVDKNLLKDAALVIEELLSQLKEKDVKGKECCKTPEVKIKESEDAKEKEKMVAETFEEKVNDDLIINLLLLGILDGLKL